MAPPQYDIARTGDYVSNIAANRDRSPGEIT
jgi:hypothetical protein